MKKEKGFTLIELMIVVAIIGILAAIALPKFASMLEKSREGATKGNISALKSAIAIYYGDNQGMWPDELTLDKGTNDQNFTYFLGNYMDDIPGVKVTAANPVNSSPAAVNKPNYKHGTAQYYIGATPPDAPTDAYGVQWLYSSLSGNLWVNSSLLDMKGESYTTYGYE